MPKTTFLCKDCYSKIQSKSNMWEFTHIIFDGMYSCEICGLKNNISEYECDKSKMKIPTDVEIFGYLNAKINQEVTGFVIDPNGLKYNINRVQLDMSVPLVIDLGHGREIRIIFNANKTEISDKINLSERENYKMDRRENWTIYNTVIFDRNNPNVVFSESNQEITQLFYKHYIPVLEDSSRKIIGFVKEAFEWQGSKLYGDVLVWGVDNTSLEFKNYEVIMSDQRKLLMVNSIIFG